MDGDITAFLIRWRGGDAAAIQELFPIVYPRLRAIAGALYKNGVRDNTVQPTALVHEVYLRLLGEVSPQLNDRRHFFALAAQVMRFVLVDHARTKATEKRGGPLHHLPLHEEIPWVSSDPHEVLELNRALEELQEIDPRKVRLVEMRYLLGCTAEETAELSALSKATVDRELRVARAWLYRRLRGVDLEIEEAPSTSRTPNTP